MKTMQQELEKLKQAIIEQATNLANFPDNKDLMTALEVYSYFSQQEQNKEQS